MSIWRLIIHTNEVNKYCLEHNVAAMGWSFNDLSPRYSELKAKADSLSDNWEDFVDCAEAMEYDFDSVIKLHNEVTAGDFIWTCLNESYYLARVEHQSKWRFCQDARTIEAANQLTNIQWHYVGNKNNLVPPTLEAAFTDERTFRRINDYDVEAFSAWLMRAFEAKTFIEPANIWRILLNPAFGDISQYCLDNNVAAMGWSFSELSDDSDLALSVKKIKTWEDYTACSKAHYGYVDSSVTNLHDRVITGDVILMRSHDKRYYFAVVSEHSKWQFNHEARNIDAANQLTNIRWHEIKNVNSIADFLERQFAFLGPTFRRVKVPEIWEFILRTLRGQ